MGRESIGGCSAGRGGGWRGGRVAGGGLPLESVHRSTRIVPGTAGRRGQGPVGKEVPGFLVVQNALPTPPQL